MLEMLPLYTVNCHQMGPKRSLLYLSSWGRCSRLLWCVCRRRETGVQTLIPWLSTALCSRSNPVHGTGSDSIRSGHTSLYATCNWNVTHHYINLKCVYETQVGFTSVSDYITYTWVRDDEVAFSEEVIQVTGCTDEWDVYFNTRREKNGSNISFFFFFW